MNQVAFIGKGSISHIPDILDKHQARTVLLVTGKASFTTSGAAEALRPFLKGKKVVRFSAFDVNPKLEDVSSGIHLVRDTKPDLVIAVGGGSVLDMGKLITVLAAQSQDNVEELIRNSALIESKSLPVVAIPTTAGSGSESTHFAVVYFNKVKYSLAHPTILPDYAIVDPTLTFQMPPELAASCGMDALTQAVESYWAVDSTEESKGYAAQAIGMILPAIHSSIRVGHEEEKTAMSIAAHLSGKAINISKTTAAHAISYPITMYFNVPHGHAVALVLGQVLLINAELGKEGLNDARGASYHQTTMSEIYTMFECTTAEACCDTWYTLMEQIGLETNLKNLGVRNLHDISLIVQHINIERLNNNPVKIPENRLYSLLESLFSMACIK